MGMYNAIIDDEYLNPAGLYKERLSQSALVAEMRRVCEGEARAAYRWLLERGMTFRFGHGRGDRVDRGPGARPAAPVHRRAVRIADRFGCDAIGIQYQQGLKDMAPASDLAEGLLNDADRPPVRARDGPRMLYRGAAPPAFQRGRRGLRGGCPRDQPRLDGARARSGHHAARRPLGAPSTATTTSGSSRSPAPCRRRTWSVAMRGAVSERQPPVYFGLGGGTIKGVSRPGEIVWSRVFIMDGAAPCGYGSRHGRGAARRRRPSDAGRRPPRSGRSWLCCVCLLLRSSWCCCQIRSA